MMPNDYKPPQNATELLKRYAAGERWFRQAELEDADLSGADLSGADLSGANLNDAKLIRAKLIRADLSGAKLNGADLNDAKLWDADLSDAKLWDADLSGAKLNGADLNGADLIRAKLSGAKLNGAKLIRAKLSGAKLNGAKLSGAKLNRATLWNVDLNGADLSEANLSSAYLRNMALHDIATATAINIRSVMIGWRSIARSLNVPDLHGLLIQSGMPDILATYTIDSLRAIDPTQLYNMTYSTFISYGGPDEAFAKKLNDALEANAVRTWFFPKHALPGDRLHRMMSRGIKQHDRTILVCSKNSLTRTGVLNEIEQALIKEAKGGGADVIIPIRLDDYIFTDEWIPTDKEDVADQLRAKVVADFRETLGDQRKFNEAFAKLMLALHVER